MWQKKQEKQSEDSKKKEPAYGRAGSFVIRIQFYGLIIGASDDLIIAIYITIIGYLVIPNLIIGY
jgi:hypothetical protein